MNHHPFRIRHLAAPLSPPQLSQVSKFDGKRTTFPVVGGLMPETLKGKKMENRGNAEMNNHGTPLSAVVSDCVRRWFQETLREARDGDVSMQVLVGQMYNNGYGVAKDAHKARIWMSRVSRTRSSVWKVCKKRPGYNASDSDSDDLGEDSRLHRST